jgi:uncharacterized membrane protein
MHRFGHHWMDGHPWGGGFLGGPGMLLSLLGILFWIALMIGLGWAIFSMLMPSIRPMLTNIFGLKSANISALEILRQRYAAGEIDSVTFEQMHERLLASYQQENHGMPRDAEYQEEGWIGYKNT